jgi:23S rRNA (adenine2030-N6)-methyltransferase
LDIAWANGRPGRQVPRRAELNYRHHFHAGNFADLLKHALLLQMLDRLVADPSPLSVVDTHAGAGVYDLEGEAAKRSGEAAKGVARLMEEGSLPAVLAPLKQAVRTLNSGGDARLYPGSPLLIVQRLRRQDQYLGCELRADDHAALERSLRSFPNARAALRDGYDALAEAAGKGPRRLTLIDPPFERGDDYARAATGAAAAVKRDGDVAAIWTPLKDLETFDSFLGRLVAARAGEGLVIEARLKPLDDPLRMNGCALVVLGPPSFLESLKAPARAVAGWIVTELGDAGARAVVGALE